MQDASDVMQLLLKTQTDFSDMEDDDPQVTQLAHIALIHLGVVASAGLMNSKNNEWKKKRHHCAPWDNPGFRDILHWLSFTFLPPFAQSAVAAPLFWLSVEFWCSSGFVPGLLSPEQRPLHRGFSFPLYAVTSRSCSEFRVHLSNSLQALSVWLSSSPLSAT